MVQNVNLVQEQEEKKVSSKKLLLRKRTSKIATLVLSLCMIMSFASAEGESTTMETFLSYGSSMLNWLLDGAGDVINAIMANPMLAFGTIFSVAGAAIAFYRKLKHS